jgi:hypothetical protein
MFCCSFRVFPQKTWNEIAQLVLPVVVLHSTPQHFAVCYFRFVSGSKTPRLVLRFGKLQIDRNRVNEKRLFGREFTLRFFNGF